MKKNKVKDDFMEQLRRVPIIQVACEKTGISRNSVYRWKNTDEKFSEEMDKALAEGEDLVNDMGESQLISLIREKNWSAISFWLRHRNPKFRDKVEVTAKIEKPIPMTEDEAAIYRHAMEIATMPIASVQNSNNSNESGKHNPPESGGDDDQQ